MARPPRERWTPPADVVSLQDARVDRALADTARVVVVTLRLARMGNHQTARDLEIDYGSERPDVGWLTREIHRAGVDVSECWEDAEAEVDPEPDVRTFPRGRR